MFSPAHAQQRLETAMAHHRAGRLAQAEALYRELHAQLPGNADIVHLLGQLALDAGRSELGIDLIQHAVAMAPDRFEYYNNLGKALTDSRRYEEAEEALHTAIRLAPDHPAPRQNLGLVRMKQGRFEEAVAQFREALVRNPEHEGASLNLALSLSAQGLLDEAIAHVTAELQRHPRHPKFSNNLGIFLGGRGDLAGAEATLRGALENDPQNPVLWSTLANVLKDAGRIREAREACRSSLRLQPGLNEVHSNLLLTTYYDETATVPEIEEEHARWQRQFADPLKNQMQPHRNERSPERRLRIGYLSPDFCEHVVGQAVFPVLAAHDRERFHVICYSQCVPGDRSSLAFQQVSDEWREIAAMSDSQLAELIRADRVDILIDLALHTSGNRALVLARKPAPVQIAWLGYPGSSGMEAIDYRITDPHLEPPGIPMAWGPEAPLRLPHCWTCYAPAADAPEPGELPALRHGWVTFGSMNNFTKINRGVLDVWAGILRAVPDSRLVVRPKGETVMAEVRALFQQHGIGAERVVFKTYYPDANAPGATHAKDEFLRRYQQIDIALDPFPYNGMTTTCDALWMGVPVVALIGGQTLGRAAFSILSAIGSPELAAQDTEGYVTIATKLASDLPRLAAIRNGLRQRFAASPLCDHANFTRDYEAALRTAWRHWCAKGA